MNKLKYYSQNILSQNIIEFQIYFLFPDNYVWIFSNNVQFGILVYKVILQKAPIQCRIAVIITQ